MSICLSEDTHHHTRPLPQCSVCLHPLAPPLPVLCSCQDDSLKHEQCFLEVAARATPYRDAQQKVYVSCEGCRERIYLRAEEGYECGSWQEINARVGGMRGEAAFLIAASVLLLGSLFLWGWLAFRDFYPTVMIALLLVSASLFLLTTGIFVLKFVVMRKLRITGLLHSAIQPTSANYTN